MYWRGKSVVLFYLLSSDRFTIKNIMFIFNRKSEGQKLKLLRRRPFSIHISLKTSKYYWLRYTISIACLYLTENLTGKLKLLRRSTF